MDGVGLELRDQGDPFIGKTIGGRFMVTDMLGAGGMGSVYKARQLSVDRDVAIKILRKDTADDTLAARRFLLEAKATSRLVNDHTVTIYDFGQTDDGHLYIAMEFLKGRTLRAKIDAEGALSLEDTVSIIDQIGESLAEAHEQGIVHRDLKPENILLAARGKTGEFVKVLDFGIARAQELNDGGNLTATGTVAGTPAYMSPEAVTGQTVDARADVYALGVMVYEMLSGEAPFKGDTPFVVMQQHVMHNPPPLVQQLPELPEAVSGFVGRCLMKDPTHRPIDASAFRRGLELALEGRDDTSPNHATIPGHPSMMGANQGEVSGSGATAAALPSDPALAAGGFDQTMPGQAILTPDANPMLSSSQTAMGTGAVLDQVTAETTPKKSRTAPMAIAAILALGVGVAAYVGMSSEAPPPKKAPVAKAVEKTPAPPPVELKAEAPAAPAAPAAAQPAPTPAPPVAPATVSITVTTTPSGAEITRGGKVLGKTPTSIALDKSESPVVLLVTKEGFKHAVINVVPDKDKLEERTLEAEVVPQAAKPEAKQRSRRRSPSKYRPSKSKPSAKPKAAPKPKAAAKPKPAPKPAKKAKPSRLDAYLD